LNSKQANNSEAVSDQMPLILKQICHFQGFMEIAVWHFAWKIADKTTNHITFIEIHELAVENKRVLLFQIPAAPNGIPVAWSGHYYGRDNESLVSLNLEEKENNPNSDIVARQTGIGTFPKPGACQNQLDFKR
jgi:hypothetical protein